MSLRRPRRPAPGAVRLGLLGITLVLMFGALGARLFQIQVVQAADFAAMGLDQRLVTRQVAPERGKVFDRNGDPLALTVEAESIFAVPPEIEDPVFAAQQIAVMTGRDPVELLDQFRSDARFVYIRRQVDHAVVQQVMDLGLAGIYTHPEATRVYPAGSVAGQVVGVVDIDGKGVEGLEFAYDQGLTGTPGELVFERDLRGRPIPQGRSEIRPALPGLDLVTTIDLPLQYVAEQTCRTTLERTEATQCWIVVLEPETGEILALAGSPSYDPTTRRSEDGSGFSNFAVRGLYEPGSTMKLITFAAALDSGTVRVEDVVPEVSWQYEVRPKACVRDDDEIYGCYRDFLRHPTRDMTVAEVFRESSNVGTIKIAQRFPSGLFEEYAQAFGFGRATGVDFSGEIGGIIDLDPRIVTDLASASIGYRVAVTPLQMAAAYAAIANDGEWVQPHLVAARIDGEGTSIPFEPERRRVVDEGVAWTLRQLLAEVVLEGTGTGADVPGYRVGGKTGTASKVGPDGTYTSVNIASFVGMAPIDDPAVVVAVVVDAPSFEFRTGGRAAAPAFAEVMEAALHRLGVTPDAPE
jgi:cell division protein FtsI/penicillin-binding protein 2